MTVSHIKPAPGPILGIVRLAHASGLALPAYETEGAVGLDLRAATPEGQDIILEPLKRILVPTGLIFELEDGFEAQIRPRSGLALKHGISVLNTPGTIDSDYRGEVQVILINHGDQSFTIQRSMRIAQAVIAPVTRVMIEERQAVSTTGRGGGGFGSTGF